MASDPTSSVRSLERGLRLLQAMNRNPHASVTVLARSIGVPRSTAYRLLDTLVALGFVKPGEAGYLLTRGVRSLSDGFIDEAWIEPAWLEMVRLSNALVWPISMLTMEAATMVIRRTTHELSPMSLDYGMSGRRFPMSETAAGTVYLAFCPDEERRLILSIPGVFPSAASGIERAMLEERIERARLRGFDARVGSVGAKTGSIAVPVVVNDRVLCCLSLIFIASALPLERAIANVEIPLKEAATTIRHAIIAQAATTDVAGTDCPRAWKQNETGSS